MDFNSEPSTVMHVDINSCFATIEQQANPFLRNKPVAIAAYATGNGCILAASYEAKALGVKTGMRVKDGKFLCSSLTILSPDPAKYRFVHLKLRKLLENYSNIVIPKSIDEFIVDFKIMPTRNLHIVALEIKNKIKKEIGEYIRVSIGISVNRYLAKTAASYRKPDGLFEINKDNFKEVFASLKLTDLCGIKKGNASRLAMVGIYSTLDFFNADISKLKLGFHSVNGYYWYLRLHGYEVDDFESVRKSFGNSYALPAVASAKAGLPVLLPILTKLIEKMSMRLRRKSYIAKGIHLGILFRDNSYWHKGKKLQNSLFASSDFYKSIYKLLLSCPEIKPVRNIAVTCFDLEKKQFSQLDLLIDINKKENLSKALDKINNKWGNFTVSPARMMHHEGFVLDRIAFGAMSEI